MLFNYRTSGIVMLLVVTMISSAIASDNLSTAESTTLVQTSSQKSSSVEFNREYVTGYWTDTKNILTSPARWDYSDWLEASLIMGTAVGLYTQDDNIKTWVQKKKNTTTRQFGGRYKKTLLVIPACSSGSRCIWIRGF